MREGAKSFPQPPRWGAIGPFSLPSFPVVFSAPRNGGTSQECGRGAGISEKMEPIQNNTQKIKRPMKKFEPITIGTIDDQARHVSGMAGLLEYPGEDI
ncbi:MAG: hypothetical protein EVA87_12715 [Rhodospirillaceae bacterium]|nr:MAG: hypothetical protein EVA87_12715 [Rhodospirillaceae bacterium]